eukprot:TRINITY_DN1234_c0_g1_i3.p1 TRINITY_DN1234_c0_g1~~TRINITY_DN1234_c0_g1_i3.p1  ORF type:complete len:105 (-),score=21.50 TRINITY_DN1234_c0_g1_i3:422-736(-)
MPLGAASTAVSGEALPSAIVGLSGQGFELPAGEVGSEAFGDAEGTVPPRFRWGSAHPTLAIFGAKLQDVSSRTVASSEKVLQSPRGDGNLAGQAKKMDFIGNFL